jgi:secreted trypsin-like serine protease
MGGPGVSDNSSAIIGGTTDTGDPGVVLLFAQQPGSQSGSLCTAEIISPHVVLTAAHCVSPTEVGANAVFTVFTGSDFNNPATGQQLSVQKTQPNPNWDPNNLPGGHDVGIAVLAQPTTIKPLPWNQNPMTQTMVGQTVRFVGYGLDNATAQTGAGVKRQTMTMLSAYDNVKLQFNDGTHETCNGDSGGPAFMTLNGVETIVGTTSYGDATCSQGGFDMRVDAEVTFIQSFVTQYDPGMTPPQNPPQTPPSNPQNPPANNPPANSNPDQNGSPGSGSPPTSGSPGEPVSSSKGAIGASCRVDADCTSHVCGVGQTGNLVCVSGNNGNSGSTIGGCSAVGSTGAADGAGLLIAMTILGLLRSRRERTARARR